MAEKTFEPDFDWSVFEKLGAANLRPQDALNELIANSIDSWIEKFTNSKSQSVIPYFWMPKFCNATDASARTLDIYKKIK